MLIQPILLCMFFFSLAYVKTDASVTANVGAGGHEPNGECIPEIGCLVNGLFLNGGAWCRAKNHLVEPKNGLLFNEMATVSIMFLLILLLLLLYLIGLLYILIPSNKNTTM